MRIVAVSDQHSFLPTVPPCDLLIVGGDICPDVVDRIPALSAPQQQKAWFDEHIRTWFKNAPATFKEATWGNHDFCGEACDFSSDSPASAAMTDLQIVVDEMTQVPADGGSARTRSLWATPWSNQFMHWAFMKAPENLAAVYDRIPAGVDILVSHQPPFGYGDHMYTEATGGVEHIGSHELLAAIERVRPRLVICGHIHEGRGRYEHQGIPIYNVSVVDDQYRHVHPVTVIDLPDV
jgi:Icc-related predicted phosphoesterase